MLDERPWGAVPDPPIIHVLGDCPLCGQPIAALAPNLVTAHGPGVCTPVSAGPGT